MEKIKEIFDKYPWLLMVLPILVVAIVAVVFLSGRNNLSHSGTPVSTISQSPNAASQTSQSSNASNATTQSSSFNLLSFILRLFGADNSTTSTQNSTTTTSRTNGSQSQQSGTSSTQTNFTGSTAIPTTTAANSTQGSSQSTQNSGGSNNDTPIQIIFKTPDGGTDVYTPPSTPPVDVTWSRYVNAADRYSIDYPPTWQLVKTAYNGHEGISLYQPGSDPNDPNVQYIGFGLASYYLLPAGDNQQNTYSYPVTISGINGTMYTQGVLGTGSIALVAQTAQGYFGMGSNISSPAFIYVYNHMLQSLNFGPQ